MKHYIAIAELQGGYTPHLCDVFRTYDTAADFLLESYDLTVDQYDKLHSEGTLAIDGDVLFIDECSCNEPHIHSDMSEQEFYDNDENRDYFMPLVANSKYKSVITVKDLEYYPEFTFDNIDYICDSIRNYIGESAQDYDSFFVLTENGDYTAVYGMSGIVPNLDKTLDLVWPIYPRDYNEELDAVMRKINDTPYKHDLCARCHEAHSISASCKIPDAKCYVLANDTFMSNWRHTNGALLVGKNVVVVPCASWGEANKVMDWIKSNRTDMKYARIVTGKVNSRNRKLSLMLEWRYSATNRPEPKTESENK